jgi:hypothetical protein
LFSQFFNFRIQGYKVFREVLLRCVMERKKCSMDKLIHNLLNAEDVKTAAQKATKSTIKTEPKR